MAKGFVSLYENHSNKGDKKHGKSGKRKPFPGLKCRMGRQDFKKQRLSLENSLWLMNPCMQQALRLCYDQFSGFFINHNQKIIYHFKFIK